MGIKGVEVVFNEAFANWGIRLPPDAMVSRQAGRILKDGWTIWYLFGSDGSTEYLDYYAMHRMTNDRHVRIYPDGKIEVLEAMSSFYIVPNDPEDAAKKEADFFAHNRAVAKMLYEKGFSLSDDESRASS